MTAQEKEQLLTLLLDARHWCQTVEARTAEGQAVTYSDPQAAAWDLTGAVCRLFGWRRACELFVEIDRCLHPRAGAEQRGSDATMTAMVGLQSWNDDPQRSHRELVAFLEQLPVNDRVATSGGLFVPAAGGGLGMAQSGGADNLMSGGPDVSSL